MSNLKQAALDLAANGFKVFPLRTRGKEPFQPGWRETATSDTRAIATWWDKHPTHNVGIHLEASGCIAIDTDPRNGGADTWIGLMMRLPAEPKIPEPFAVQHSGRGDGGQHLIYRVGQIDGLRVAGKLGPGVDVKYRGFVVGAGSIHPDTGKPYTIDYGSGMQSGLLPVDSPLGRLVFVPVKASDVSEKHSGFSDSQWADTLAALEHIPADERETWISVGMALHSTGHEDALETWDSWSQGTSRGNYVEGACGRHWESFSDRPGGLDYRFILAEGERNGWKNPARTVNPTAQEAARLFADSPLAAAAAAGADGDVERDPGQHDGDFVSRPEPAAALEPLGGGFRWSDFDDQDIPERQWVVQDWVGRNHVTSLYGRGGIGKSLLAQQLATCVVTGQPFLGIPVTKGRVLGLFCEDDRDELRRRAAGLNRALGTRLADIDGFEAHARIGMDNILVAPDPKTGIGRPTAVLAQLRAQLKRAQDEGNPYILVILDNAGQVFSVSENDRNQVTQALNQIAGLADKYHCGVLLLGHPAKSTESQYSGSTAWEACVRSRLFIGRPKDPKTGLEIGSKDDRVLSQAKANYATTDDIPLVWRGGAYVRTDMGEEADKRREEMTLKTAEILDTITAALELLAQQGAVKPSSERTSPRYLPKLMTANDLTNGHSEKEIGKALGLAIQAGRVAVKTERDPKKGREITWIELPKGAVSDH